MDETLSWKEHVTHVGAKISLNLGMLCRARKILPTCSCLMLFNAMVLPLFTIARLYGTVAGQAPKPIWISFTIARRVLSRAGQLMSRSSTPFSVDPTCRRAGTIYIVSWCLPTSLTAWAAFAFPKILADFFLDLAKRHFYLSENKRH